ncbi:unnamed protein product, partial [Rotaria magnacalcarata]
ISGSEDTSRRLITSVKSRVNERIDEDNDDDPQKPNVNDDSNDSARGMIIDEGDERASNIEEKNQKVQSSSALTTITSLVEREISKTLSS